jgi:hypothetical protein
VQAAPAYVPALTHLAHALRQAGQRQDAIAVLQAAEALRPQDPDLRIARGNLLFDLMHFAQAEAAYRAALAIAPGNAAAARNLGNALAWQHRFAAASDAYRAAQRARPDWPSPGFHLAVLDLLHGNYAAGFRGYENRLAEPALAASRIDRARPAWRGKTDPAGKTILLHDEQGFGDTFLFARFIPILAGRGARLVLQVRPDVLPLLAAMPGVAEAVPATDPPPPHDLHCPLPSLPFALGIETPPSTVPYLTAPEEARARASLPTRRPRIALTWTAGPAPAHRSLPLRLLAPLLAFDAAFIPVQKDITAPDAAFLKAFPNVHPPGPALADFSATAAILAKSDLVITVDTATANLAGALGRKTWVALAALADWRWGLAPEATDWYPTARLFRQDTPGDWTHVIAAMRAALDGREGQGLRP